MKRNEGRREKGKDRGSLRRSKGKKGQRLGGKRKCRATVVGSVETWMEGNKEGRKERREGGKKRR